MPSGFDDLTGLDDLIGFDDLVQDVMNGRPATIRVFLDFRMGCVGCPIACFHTVDDACREHGVDRDAFLKALRKAAAPTSGVIDSGDINATLCPTSRK